MCLFFRKWKHLFCFVEIEMLPGSSNCSDKVPYPDIRNENTYRVSTVLDIQTHTVHKPDELMVWIHVDQSECTLLATQPKDAILSRIPAASAGLTKYCPFADTQKLCCTGNGKCHVDEALQTFFWYNKLMLSSRCVYNIDKRRQWASVSLL